MKERPMYMSGNAVLWGIGSVLGPVVSPAPVFLVFWVGGERVTRSRSVALLLRAVLRGDGCVEQSSPRSFAPGRLADRNLT